MVFVHSFFIVIVFAIMDATILNGTISSNPWPFMGAGCVLAYNAGKSDGKK